MQAPGAAETGAVLPEGGIRRILILRTAQLPEVQ